MRSYLLEFKFEIETPDDPENDLREVSVYADVKVSPYDPGCCSGPADSCYPPEGGEVEIDLVKIDGVAWPEPQWPKGLIEVIEKRAFKMSQDRYSDYED
jgi:hypothetical protein